jgi:hypothetical protein
MYPLYSELLDFDYYIYIFLCKPGILRARLQRLIPRALWNPNGRQVLPKSFNSAACPKLNKLVDGFQKKINIKVLILSVWIWILLLWCCV